MPTRRPDATAPAWPNVHSRGRGRLIESCEWTPPQGGRPAGRGGGGARGGGGGAQLDFETEVDCAILGDGAFKGDMGR